MERKYAYRRKLPHFQRDSEVFFITFCTKDRWILPPSARDIVLETCRYGHGKMFHLYAALVMPDHVHLLLDLMTDADGPVSIPQVMQAIKSTSAHRVNKALARTGKVWQDESFDRALRQEESHDAAIEYMMGNPVRAGLVLNPLDYGWFWKEQAELLDSNLLRARTPVAP
jgi:REP element-mobilizing transposase RayT